MITLRDYQQEIINQVRDKYLQGHRSVLAGLPTAAGKTIVFTDIAAKSAATYARMGGINSVWILVHRIELLRQASNSLTNLNIAHGLINPKYTPKPHELIQVGSVQTIINRLSKLRPPGLIIIDEAHHARKGNTWGKIIDAFPKARILGVTATAVRGDGIGLGINSGGYFDAMVQGPQPNELMDEGWLTRARVFGSPKKIDVSDVEIVGGDYDKQQILSKIAKSTITGDAVEHYSEICRGVPAIAFCASVEEAEKTAESFRNAGYSSESVDGTMDDEQRASRFSDLMSGEIEVLTSCDLISEGTDLPHVVCGILLRPTASLGLHMQQIGRLLRTAYAKGYPIDTAEQRLIAIAHGTKPNAIILDHVNNVMTHGLPDEPRDWELEGTKKQTKRTLKLSSDKIKTMQCPKCYYVHTPQPVCPNVFPTVCGHVYEVSSREIKKVDGTLVEITFDMRFHIKKEKSKEIGRAKTLIDFEAIAAERHYSPKWAMMMWQWKQSKVSDIPIMPIVIEEKELI